MRIGQDHCDLAVDVQSRARQPERRKRTCHRQRNGEQHREGVQQGFELGRQHHEHEHEGEREREVECAAALTEFA
jgi:hypothetical protein